MEAKVRGLSFFTSSRTNNIYEKINIKSTEKGNVLSKFLKGVKQSVLKFSTKKTVAPQTPFKSNLLEHARSLNNFQKTEGYSESALSVAEKHVHGVNKELASNSYAHITMDHNRKFVVKDKVPPPLPERNPGMIRPAGEDDTSLGLSPEQVRQMDARFARLE